MKHKYTNAESSAIYILFIYYYIIILLYDVVPVFFLELFD